MSKIDPYSPPKSDLGDARFMHGKLVQDTFAALVFMLLLLSLRYASPYFDLVRTGVVRPFGLLLLLVASVCLYLGAILFRFKGSSKTLLFLLASIAFAAAVPVLLWPSSFALVGLLGFALGGAGYWLARRRANGFDVATPDLETAMPMHTTGRPVSVYFVFLLCCAPAIFIALFLWENWSGLSLELFAKPMTMISMFLPTLLFMAGGFFLLLLRKQAIILFVLYFVLQLGRVVASFGTLLPYLDLLLVFGVIAYSIHLLNKQVLR